MPELAELRLTAEFVNEMANDKVFYGVRKNPVHKGAEVEVPFAAFTIDACSRGKQLLLTLKKLNSDEQVKLLMSMGMSGHFGWVETGVLSKHSHLRFKSDNGSLDFIDVRRFGKWKLADNWSADRGPDPTTEFQSFVRNIKDNLHKPEFNKPIHLVLMNQKYFNGVGNYIRSEVLYRIETLNPFINARDAIKEYGEKIFMLCKAIPERAYILGGGEIKDWKNPFKNDSDYNRNEFFLCYGKKSMSSFVDRNNRRFWFDPKWSNQVK